MQTPIAFIIFNRPDKTKRIFAEIAKVKPSKLFVIADGPRVDHPEDIKNCADSRAIIDCVDWDCEVLKNYSDVNLGCGKRIASGIGWVFENVDEAIILEDDLLPHPSFFRFCEELLEKYRDDKRVMMISGRNDIDLFDYKVTPYSYYFRYTTSVWGWATWRRAWQYHDLEMKLWPMLRNTSWLLDILINPKAVANWQSIFDHYHIFTNKPDSWAYQWAFALWSQNGLSIIPNTNLVCNFGFGEDATHTKAADSPRFKLLANEMFFPLKHPPYVVRDRKADLLFLDLITPKKQYLKNILWKRFKKLVVKFDERYFDGNIKILLRLIKDINKSCA